MRLLVVADLHYSLPQFDWVLNAAASYDLVILAGDVLDVASIVEPGAQMVVVKQYLRRLRELTTVLVCSGNHDLDALGANGEKQAIWLDSVRRLGIPSDGDTLTVENTLISICPWWDGPLTQQQIGAQLEAAAAQRQPGQPWIWVYHAPPPDSPISWGGHRYFGDAALPAWIAHYRPDVVFCGHVHEAPFVRNGSWIDRIGDTWLFNAGRQIGQIPTNIALDTMAGEAVWFSMEGAESVKLDRPLERPIPPLMALPGWLADLLKAASPT